MFYGFGTFVNYNAFELGWAFLKKSLAEPGGLSLYAAGFLSQLYYFSWLGAAVITIMAFGFQAAVRQAANLTSWRGATVLSYAPPLLLLAIYGRYWHRLEIIIALLAATWCWVAYARLSPKRPAPRIAAFTIMFIVLYVAAGAASIVFGV